MTCYHPLTAYRVKDGKSENGKWPITFDRDKGLVDMPIQIPCGRCIGCRLERSRQWAVRLMHEHSLHDESCFLTLTYDPEHLPDDLSLHKEHFQKFMKRLRKSLGNARIRFFACGEYGDKTDRPHYHAIIFGYDPKDKQFYKTVGGNNLWISASLNRLWSYGFVVVGSVSFESCAYVARYIMKKQYARDTEFRGRVGSRRIGPRTMEDGSLRELEFCLMSRRPGIGSKWIDRFLADTYPRDEVLQSGFRSKPPRYYDTRLELVDPESYALVQSNRRRRASHLSSVDQTPDRLEVREKVRTARTSSLSRPL